jgi:hypothetical protein
MARLQIFVQGDGKREIRMLELPAHATVRELVEAAQAHGVVSQDGDGHGDGHTVAVYTEDGDAALPADATLEAVGLGNHSSVHLSRCTRVAVMVHYNGRNLSESFGPGVPMHRVKEWAVGNKGFNLNPVDAAEHVLQLTGTSDRPDEDVHIGSLVGTTSCGVEFDLVAKVRVEG